MSPETAAQFSRLQAGSPLEGADLQFYLHELREKELMDAGVDYETAHAQTMAELGQEPWQLYDPLVIQQYPEYFNDYYRTHAGAQ